MIGLYDLDDPTVIAAGITEKLCGPLNKMAPVKLRNLKTNKKKGFKLNDNLKAKMKSRDELRMKAKTTNDANDWDRWKRMKNEVNISESQSGGRKEVR